MLTHPQDKTVAILENISEGRNLRRNWLQKVFNQKIQFGAATHSSEELNAIADMGAEVMPYLENIFSNDNDEFSYSMNVQTDGGRFHVPEMIWSRQHVARDKRHIKFHPRLALHEFGMSREFGQVCDILERFSKYVLPLSGKRATLFLANRSYDQSELHIDGNNLVNEEDYMAITFPLGGEQSSAIVEKLPPGSQELVTIPNDSLVAILGKRRHGTPASTKFRPIIGIQPPVPSLF